MGCPPCPLPPSSPLLPSVGTRQCPVGSVSATQVPCPGGRYGSARGLTSDACSHNCDGGAGFTSSGAAAGAMGADGGVSGGGGAFAVPLGAGGGGGVGLFGSRVSGGKVGSSVGRRGVEGGSGLCVPSLCAPGHFCPPNSTRATEVACGGAGLFCPVGSALPTPVAAGHYTVGHLSIPGAYQHAGDTTTRSAEVACEPGTYCTGGVRVACPAGQFGDVSGLTTPGEWHEERAGLRCLELRGEI